MPPEIPRSRLVVPPQRGAPPVRPATAPPLRPPPPLRPAPPGRPPVGPPPVGPPPVRKAQVGPPPIGPPGAGPLRGLPPIGPPGAAPDPRPKPREIARARRRRRQRRFRIVALVVLLVLAGLGGLVVVHGGYLGHPARKQGTRSAGPSAGRPAASAGASAAGPLAGVSGGSGVPAAGVPSSGPGTFAFAAGTGPVIGTAGPVRRFRVAVENGTGQSADQFAAAAEQVLGDQRGWASGGSVRFQRVPQTGVTADFTLYLATSGTTEKLCAQGGLHTAGYTSCRLPGQVIINLTRWLVGVPNYGAPLQTYRQFALNHEIGRQLGYGNESCPGPNQPAPVMQQQTLGLAGCVAYAWPYLGGRLYQGQPIP